MDAGEETALTLTFDFVTFSLVVIFATFPLVEILWSQFLLLPSASPSDSSARASYIGTDEVGFRDRHR